MIWIIGFVAVGLVSAFSVDVAAEPPPTLTHQGRLVADDGTPVSGAVELTYTLYNAAQGGEILWQEVVEAELDGSGFYSVVLGSESNPVNATVLEDGAIWMGVKVDDGEELEPRIGLHSVPFAQVAARATSVADGSVGPAALGSDFRLGWDKLDGVPNDVWQDTLEDLQCGADEFPVFDGGAWGCMAIGDLGEPGSPALTCASGQVSRFDGSNWVCDEAVRSVAPGVGIGITGTSGEPEIRVLFGQEVRTVCEGNDPRLSDARAPTADSEHYIQNQSAGNQDASFRISGDGRVGGNLQVAGQVRAESFTGNTTFDETLILNTYPPGVSYQIGAGTNAPVGSVCRYGIVKTMYFSACRARQVCYEQDDTVFTRYLDSHCVNDGPWGPWTRVQ
ncbi:MAG: pyocin knob domain-containing protein [Bradymonadaceae bacterium]